MYVFDVKTKPAAAMPKVKAWYLDHPRHDGIGDLSGLRGWVFPADPSDMIGIELVIDGQVAWSGAPEIPAPSARQQVFGSDAPKWSDLARFQSLGMPREDRLIELVIVCGDQRYVAASITKKPAVFKVQEGGRGHLFLDNDTNKSVDQFTGRLQLGGDILERWEGYFRELDEIASAGTEVRLMICPAKEEVFQDLYPHPRAFVTPVDQVLSLTAEARTIFPVRALAATRDRSFSQIDTHWSDYGACIGAREYLRSVGLDWACSHLPDSFVEHQRYGDLGGKLPEKRLGTFEVVHPSQIPEAAFKNGIWNHGRMWVFENPHAPVQETLVLFGDSYSVSLSSILSHVFRRVVYTYTAGQILTDVLEIEAPAYVLCQTNQRFVTGAPAGSDTLARKCEQKRGQVNASEQIISQSLQRAEEYYLSLIQ